MLKHTEILKNMSAKQKIALVANVNCLADDEYAALGIPRVKIASLDELFAKEGDGLTPYTLARSWNTDLITNVTEQIIEHNCDDANIIMVPAPKINLGAEGEAALSEDPLLATNVALAFIEAVNNCKRIAILPDLLPFPFLYFYASPTLFLSKTNTGMHLQNTVYGIIMVQNKERMHPYVLYH